MSDNTKTLQIIEIGIGLIQIILLIVLINYLYQIHQNRHKYPIQQLSPIMTMLQAISFYIFQLMILINFYYIFNYGELTWTICIDPNEGKGIINFKIYKNYPYYVLTIVYLFSRGSCFTFTLMKSLRVLMAFSKQRLQKNTLVVKIFNSEIQLIIIALLYGMMFPMCTIITNSYIYKFEFYCSLQVYENNTKLVFANSLVEEILTIYLMFQITNNNYEDNLINLTIKLQFYYICWFALNSFLFKIFPWGQYFVGISCLVRCFYMFYNFTCVPLQEPQEHPNLYIIYDQVIDFRLISSKVFNNFYKRNNYSLSVFEKFLSKSQRIVIFQTEIENIASRENFSETVLFNKYLQVVQLSQSCQDYHKLVDEIIKILNLQPTDINPYPTIDVLQQDLYDHFESIYKMYFQQTIAFQTIKEITYHNQIIQDNFKILKMPLNEWNYFDNHNNI